MQTSSLFESINTFNPESLYRIITVHVSFACTKSKRPNMLNSLFPIVREFPGFARKSGPRLGSKKKTGSKRTLETKKGCGFRAFGNFRKKPRSAANRDAAPNLRPQKKNLRGRKIADLTRKGGVWGVWKIRDAPWSRWEGSWLNPTRVVDCALF